MSDNYKILVREGDMGPGYRNHRWRQYMLISDESCIVVDMVQALFGWNLGRVTKQGAADWPNMKRDDIVAYRFRHDTDGLTKDAELGDFRARLVSHAEAG